MKKALALACAAALMPVSASAATIFGVDETNRLVSFSSAAPGTLMSSVKISGANSSIEALDFRPLNNTLYGLGTDRVVYTINTMTGVATAASAALGIEGSVFGFDFNPTIDRVRIVSNTNNNYVYNPNDGSLTGAPTTTTLGYAAGDPNAGRDPGVSAAAYTSSTFGAPGTSTQLRSFVHLATEPLKRLARRLSRLVQGVLLFEAGHERLSQYWPLVHTDR